MTTIIFKGARLLQDSNNTGPTTYAWASAYSLVDTSNQVVSGLGAVISVIMVTLLTVTGYFIYQVYYKGEMRLPEPAAKAKDREAHYIDEEQQVQNKGPAGPPGAKDPKAGPQAAPSKKPRADLDEIDLEFNDGNAQPEKMKTGSQQQP